ncbi:MAG: LysR family transcriptional regulator [Oceanicaulis sp.]
MRVNYKHLRYFRAVAHEGRLTRAAERLNLSQSALSTQIRQLEDQLGHALFERTGRTLTLTEAGRVALDYADAIFTAGEELESVMKGGAGAARRTLNVGALATLSRNFQTDLLAPLLASGAVEVHLRSGSLSELMAELAAHNLDMVLTNQAPLREADSGWTVHTLAEQKVSLIGAPARIGEVRDMATLLKSHPLILPSRRSGVRSGFDALAMRLGLSPEIAAEVDDMAMLRLFARNDAGLAVAPPIVVRDELASGRLVEAADLPGIAETFYAITLERRFPNPLVAEILSGAPPASSSGVRPENE